MSPISFATRSAVGLVVAGLALATSLAGASEHDAASAVADKPTAEKSHAEKSHAEKSQAEKSQAEKSQAEKSQAEKSQAEKSQAEKSQAEKSHAEKVPAEKPPAEKPTAEKPTAEKPTAEKPTAEKPTAEKPTAEKLPAERPASGKTAAAEKAAAGGKPSEEHHATAVDPIQNPIDRLRERLAQKLGATKPPGNDTPNVVRIVSKASARSAGDGDFVTTPSAAHAGLGRRPPRPVSVEPAAPALSGNPNWDYAGVNGGPGGPDSWGQLKPEFSKCASGSRQSPIDIQGGIRVDLDPVVFDYKASSFRVLDNGHTVQVNVGAGNSIEVMGHRYDLIQFHFHRPSEERVNGKQFDMVVHLVHRDLDGHLAVIAVLLERGSALKPVQTVWNNLPLEKGDEVVARTLLDPTDLLPPTRSYYTYMGSLTTPPCSEGVLWMVMKTPLPISAEQVGIFAHLYPMNARPLQAASGRLIKESN